MTPPRGSLARAAQWAVAAVVLSLVGYTFVRQWRAVGHQPLVARPEWSWIAASGAGVFVSYAVLVQTWRAMIGEWGSRLGFLDAARIWFVANLGRYVPGKVWQIGAMGMMAQRRGVHPIAATGSAVISTAVNIAVGTAVAMLTGWPALEVLSRGHARAGVALFAIIVGAVALLPVALPRLLGVAERLLGRRLDTGALPTRAIVWAVIGNVAAWLVYGTAFQAFVRGVLGAAAGRWADYVAVWAASYVVGYLVLIVPGGIGVREAAQSLALTSLGLATPPQAALVAVASRLWLTVLEVLPGVAFLAFRPLSHRSPHSDREDGSP